MRDLSGLKDLDEIYNFDVEAESKRRSLDLENNELRFGAVGFWENEKIMRRGCGSAVYRPIGR